MATTSTSSSSSRQLFFHLRRPPLLPPPSPSSFLPLKHFSTAATATLSALRLRLSLPSATAVPPRRFSPKPPHVPLSMSLLHTHSGPESEQSDDEDEEDDNKYEDEDKDRDDVENGVIEPLSESAVAGKAQTVPVKVEKPPSLTVKEKKELASYAHSLGKKLKTQQVGKSGVTANVVASFSETLESKEILKLKIHSNCPGELEDVVNQLEESTGSVVVGQIGRTVILYRPSLTKLKAEEKRQQARRVFIRKGFKATPDVLKKARVARVGGPGRRGSSRFT